MKTKDDKFRGFAFITFDDYDSVDRCILGKPHKINDKELDVRKAIPREQTSRLNGLISNNTNTYINADFYHSQNRYQPQIMINHPTLSFPSFSPYAYFPPTNYLSKPMPLMGPTPSSSSQPGALPPQTYIVPPDLLNSAFFRNQTIPSQAASSPVRTNNNDNIENQNGTNAIMSNDNSSESNDAAKNHQVNYSTTAMPNYGTSVRSKPRSTYSGSTTNDPNSEQHRKLFIGGLSFKEYISMGNFTI
ncbi:unnamed protein product [Rotaria magnacalcarata]|uniref:RRM domain-containing protein n=1 Tax=Rotaria magnacalcarata TaxID=392030 RepID=A0A8S3F729_9BILA|nr:unnamed protein product [Rotaria magnacalcarata]CAF5194372.1 unnamed protein product [Rotaria magnacalcarata]